MQKPAPRPEPRKAAIAFIFAIVLLDVIALGIVIPVLPKLVESMVGETARGAEIFGLFGTAWALMQFFCSPLLGALSDRFGRRPVLLISMAGHGLDYILMAVAPNLIWLFVGRVISGITAASFGTAYAYIADVTDPEKRAQNFGVVGAAFGVGFVLGPALGGILGAYDPRLPFWVAAGFSLANAAYGYLFVPESLPPERRMAFSLARANPLGSLKLLRRRPELLGLAGVTFLHQLAHASLPAIAVLYTSYRYGWDSQMMGLSLAAIGIMSGLVQGTLIKPVVARIGERRTLLVGLLFGAVGFAIYGVASTSLQFWAGIPVMALWGIAGAATQAMMSKLVTASEQGQLQGANASIMAVAGLIGPGLFSLTFAWSIARGAAAQLPGLAFLLAAALLVVAVALAWQVTRGAQVSAGDAS
jgi:DHA1 family tetracycline resistance protein-like MFS transporter